MVSGKALAAGTERDEPAASALPLTRRTQHEIRICITEDHEDWPLIEAHTGLQRDQYVEELLQCRLSVAMTGFLPGFVYLKGLPEASGSTQKFAVGADFAEHVCDWWKVRRDLFLAQCSWLELHWAT